MAESLDPVVEAVDLKILAEATEHGWTPKDKFRGDPERWVDAKTFVERAATVLPLIRKRNAELTSELQELRTKDATRDGELKAIRAALKAVEETQQEDLADRVDAAKEDLESQIADASEAGDHKRVAKLTVQLTDLVVAEKVKTKTAPIEELEPNDPPPVSAEHKAWLAENQTWLATDTSKASMAVAFGQAVQRDGFRGKAFYEELDKRLDKYYDTKPGGDSKVSGGRTSADSSDSRSGGSKSFSDLPADAREACRSMERRMVGTGKPHKDTASWHKSYVRQYFQSEA